MKLLSGKRARRISRNLAGLLLDLSVAAAAFGVAFLTIYGYPRAIEVPALEEKLLGFLLSSVLSFVIFAPYRGSWRYVSIPDLTTIIKSALGTVMIYTVGVFLMTRGQNVPRSVLVLSFVYMVIGLTGMRLGYRIFLESVARFRAPGIYGERRSGRNVLLCGLSDKAETFIRSTRRNAQSGFHVVGIVDDGHLNQGRIVQGVKVMGNLERLERIVDGLKRRRIAIDELVVTETMPARRRLTRILERANALSLKVTHIPDPTEIAEVSAGTLIQPRPIELEDLLERPEVNPDLERVAGLIEGRVVLATGAGGSIGSELSRQIAGFRPARLVITDSSEFHLYTLDRELRDKHRNLDIVSRIVDVRDKTRVSQLFAEFRPELVFHAAALKHVPLMEENPLEAVKTNMFGTRNVADAALTNAAAIFVMISTDKAVNPTNVMGATKRAAEAYCQALDVVSENTRFKTVRFGNVLGSNGSVVPRFQEQIAAGGPVKVTHPQIVRYFMTIPEAVRLVLHASAHARTRQGERGKIMVLDMGKPVRIVDLAERMIQLAGYRPRADIDIVFTGLRPGEKLFEELFDPSEAPDGRTKEGYVLASPRIIDRRLVEKTMAEILACVEREDIPRTLELLAHIVPEYRRVVADNKPAPAIQRTEPDL